jgi:hypothetical protein
LTAPSIAIAFLIAAGFAQSLRFIFTEKVSASWSRTAGKTVPMIALIKADNRRKAADPRSDIIIPFRSRQKGAERAVYAINGRGLGHLTRPLAHRARRASCASTRSAW